MLTMFPQPSGETEIIRVFQIALPGDQGIQLSFQGLGTLGEESQISLGYAFNTSAARNRAVPSGRIGLPDRFYSLRSLSGPAASERGIFV